MCNTRSLNNSTWMAIIWHTWWFLLTAKTLHFHIYLWVNGCELLQRIRCHEPLNVELIIQQKFADFLQIWCAHWKCAFNWRFKDVTFRICQLIYPGIFMKCLNLFGCVQIIKRRISFQLLMDLVNFETFLIINGVKWSSKKSCEGSYRMSVSLWRWSKADRMRVSILINNISWNS